MASRKIGHNDSVFKHFKADMLSSLYIHKVRPMAVLVAIFASGCNGYS